MLGRSGTNFLPRVSLRAFLGYEVIGRQLRAVERIIIKRHHLGA
jgi:hypothetical protein